MNSLLEELLAHGPVLLDGALGTELQARGLESGVCPDTWNLSHPSEVESVARAYVEAGSRIILTNTFRSNRIALEAAGLADKVAAFNRAGVEIARRAAQGRAKVFGSLGPCGKMVVMGEVSAEEAARAFAEQAQIQAEAGADGFVLETMADVEEVKAALEAIKPLEKPVVASFVFDSGKQLDRTLTGVTPERAARELTEAGADVIGANCAWGIEAYVPICQRLRASTDRPIWIKANAGLPELVDGAVRYQATAQSFAASIPALVQAGANFVGGCCGTNPDFIRAIGKSLKG
jgi:5-methyltetrahydrofolate--homocysteine methyltransferase